MMFESYKEALDFVDKSATLSPSKPYKRLGKWAVSMVRGVDKAKYKSLDSWQKPSNVYDEWKGVEALYHLPVPPPLPKIEKFDLDEEMYE
jgi:hypothetical protein